jgi:murein L,D-transpeptidase YcbB/YkuD
MFCCAILFTFLPFYALAADESLSERRQLCDISALEKAISDYLQIAYEGGWPQIPSGRDLREGDRNDRVSFLRKRLIVSGDLEPANKPNQLDAVNGNLIETIPVSQTHRDPTVNGLDSNRNGSPPLPKKKPATKNDPAELVNQDNIFDEMLKEAVQRFQIRHGLTANGIVGAETLKELNVPARERIKQLSATIERCSKLPPLQENRYILINITDFTLNLFEDGKPVLTMPVIVGKKTQQTPEFDGLITNLIINPAWSVPYSIASKEYLPKLKKNPGYLSRSRMRVYRANQRIDPSTINWSSYSANNFPLLLRQDPGPGNSLGRIKFMFTNPHDIYLHDTTTKKLFQRFPRAFSHGCIRVKDPIDLAAYLLQDTPMGSEEAIKSAINKGKTRSLDLPSPIPINIVYITAWVDAEGTVQFRPNIYNRKISSEEEIIVDTPSPSKTPSAGTVPEQPKAMIKTTGAATAGFPDTAVPVAHPKPVVKTPVTTQSTVQATTPAKAATTTATSVAQTKPAAFKSCC